MELQRISQASLDSVLKATGRPSERRLSVVEAEDLGMLISQMADRYPSQDLSLSLEGYLWDLERLAVRYSLLKVKNALAELRIQPGQQFFPRPDEVATAIAQMDSAEETAFNRRKSQEILSVMQREFWNWVSEQVEFTGETEQQVLDAVRTPGFTGRKERTA